MAASKTGGRKAKNEPITSYYTRKQTSITRMMEKCQRIQKLKGVPTGQIWDNLNIKVNNNSVVVGKIVTTKDVHILIPKSSTHTRLCGKGQLRL